MAATAIAGVAAGIHGAAAFRGRGALLDPHDLIRDLYDLAQLLVVNITSCLGFRFVRFFILWHMGIKGA